MFKVTLPPSYRAEREYIVHLMMEDFLGLPITIEFDSSKSYVSISADDNKELMLADKLFSTPDAAWLTASSLPPMPLKHWTIPTPEMAEPLVDDILPVIFGNDPAVPTFYQGFNDEIMLGLDIFGSAFYFLTRYEEYVKAKLDRFVRFPVTLSLAYQEGFYHRPIINEYIEVLWHCMTLLWPQLTRKEQRYQAVLSHDIEERYPCLDKQSRGVLSGLAKNLFQRGEPSVAIQQARSLFQRLVSNEANDQNNPIDTFDSLMETSEFHGHQSTFYFRSSHPDYDPDNRYEIGHPLIRQLLGQIHGRGHAIGLQISETAAQSAPLIERELDYLRRILDEEMIPSEMLAGRQEHFRWSNPGTWRAYHDAGLCYDTSLTFADAPGFRCGICYEYPVFDLKQRKRLTLLERPLIVMDSSLKMSMYRTESDVIQGVTELASTCRQFSGAMTFLWHKTRLLSRNDLQLYAKICDAI